MNDTPSPRTAETGWTTEKRVWWAVLGVTVLGMLTMLGLWD